MERRVAALENQQFDLIIVGGGIFGACAAWDAIQRGLSVALIEREDFCSSTSANSFKIVHGGMRYLQHGNVYRIRQSAHARRTFLRIASHLVKPLPIVVPTYGHALKGKELLRLAMGIYDVCTFDRNAGIVDPTRRIPQSFCLSKQEVLDRYPGIDSNGLTGAGVFYDGQMYNPPRIVLAYLRTAVEAGAVVANYVEAVRFLMEGTRIYGVEARDVLNGDQITIRGKTVLNAAGPHAELLIDKSLNSSLGKPTPWSRDAYFVVSRSLIERENALALAATTKDPDALLSRGGRHLFLVPWRHYTLVGVWHKVYSGHPDCYNVSDQELEGFIQEVNCAYPALKITRDDVSYVNAGLIPFGENKPGEANLKFGHSSRLVDHAKEGGVDGLVTLIGVRFTMGPADAVNAVDLIFKKLGKKSIPSKSHATRLFGGDIDDFDGLVKQALHGCPIPAEERTIRALIHNYGTAYSQVYHYIKRDRELGQTMGEGDLLKAQVIYAVREEMAQTLTDVVLRRTDLGTGEYPGMQAIDICIGVMANELQWSQRRTDDEIAAVNRQFALRNDRVR